MKKIDNSVKITGIIVIGIIILALIGLIFFNSLSPNNTISSNGYSTVKVLPDFVSIYFNVQTYGATSSEASDENAEIVEKMKTSLKKEGFTESEIQTLGFNIYPEYDYKTGSNIIKRYVASHSIKIEIPADEIEKASKVIDIGVGAGAGISYINFEIGDNNQKIYKIHAIKEATEDAKAKAQALAEGVGKNLGNLVSVSSSDFSYYPRTLYSISENGVADAAQAKAATDIQPSEQEVTASVTAVFKLR